MPRLTLKILIIQVLREDANNAEMSAFEEMGRGFRLANAPNVIKLIGALYETRPMINIFEGGGRSESLKTYLLDRTGILFTYTSTTYSFLALKASFSDEYHALADSGELLRICKEITSGLAALFDVGAVPTDLGTRSCHVVVNDTNMATVKLGGDLGLAPTRFLEDYLPVNGDGQPVRWIPPEVLAVLDRSGEADDSSDDSSSSEDEEGNSAYLRVFPVFLICQFAHSHFPHQIFRKFKIRFSGDGDPVDEAKRSVVSGCDTVGSFELLPASLRRHLR